MAGAALMFALEKHVKIWQLIGAVLAIPAGIAGTYSVYRNYVTGDVSCEGLRSSIISVLDKNISDDAKRALLRKDVADFDAHCGAHDADAAAIFDAAVATPALAAPAIAAPAIAAPTEKRPVAPADAAAAIFGLSRSGEHRGWVSLFRREGEGRSEPNFGAPDPIEARSLPAIGQVMTARMMVPVWLDSPATGETNDRSKLQGRIAAGGCVRLITRGAPGRPNWAQVEPAPCVQAN